MATGDIVFKEPKRKLYLKRLANGVGRIEAAEGICSWDTIRGTINEDPTFERRVQIAQMRATDKVEEALYKRAVEDGVVRAQEFWLKNRSPDRWADSRNINVNTKVEVHEVQERLDSKMEKLRERLSVEVLETVPEEPEIEDVEEVEEVDNAESS